jgi:hypothetical protein
MRNCISDRLYRAHAVAAEVADELVTAHLLYGFRPRRWPLEKPQTNVECPWSGVSMRSAFRRVTRKTYKGDSGSCLVTRPAVT